MIIETRATPLRTSPLPPLPVASFEFEIAVHDRATGDRAKVPGARRSWDAILSGDGKTILYTQSSDSGVDAHVKVLE